MKKLLSILFCLVFTLPLSSCQEDRFVLPAEKDEPGMSINPYLDNLWATVKANEAGLDTWNILQFLLEACDLGWDQKYIKVGLTNLANTQVRTEGDPYYGQNSRYVAGTYTDRNNVQFSLQLASLLKMLYWDTLNEENNALLDEFLDYAVYACVDYTDIAVTYSNIYLMKTWNLIALGENLPSDRTWGKYRESEQQCSRSIQNTLEIHHSIKSFCRHTYRFQHSKFSATQCYVRRNGVENIGCSNQ